MLVDALKSELIQMLNDPVEQLYGVIVRKNTTMGVYWSPLQWVSPVDGLSAQSDKFLYLGVEGWYPDDEMKDIFEYFKRIAPDWPSWPGEYVDLDYGRSPDEIAVVRHWYTVECELEG